MLSGWNFIDKIPKDLEQRDILISRASDGHSACSIWQLSFDMMQRGLELQVNFCSYIKLIVSGKVFKTFGTGDGK